VSKLKKTASLTLGLVVIVFIVEVATSTGCLFRVLMSVDVSVVVQESSVPLSDVAIEVVNAGSRDLFFVIPETFRTDAGGRARVEFWAATHTGAGVFTRLFQRPVMERALEGVALVCKASGYESRRVPVEGKDWAWIEPGDHILRAKCSLPEVRLEKSR
jgi:hypothetical protein